MNHASLMLQIEKIKCLLEDGEFFWPITYPPQKKDKVVPSERAAPDIIHEKSYQLYSDVLSLPVVIYTPRGGLYPIRVFWKECLQGCLSEVYRWSIIWPQDE